MILWGDRSLHRGKGEARGMKGTEEQHSASVHPLLPLSWRESGLTLPCLCQGTQWLAAGKSFPPEREPGVWHMSAAVQAVRHPGPVRPRPGGEARRDPLGARRGVASHTDTRTHHPRCAAKRPPARPTARPHSRRRRARHGDDTAPPRPRPSLPVRRRDAAAFRACRCRDGVGREGSCVRRGWGCLAPDTVVSAPARPSRTTSRVASVKMLEKGQNATKRETCENKGVSETVPEVRRREKVLSRGCLAEGSCGADQGLCKWREGPCKVIREMVGMTVRHPMLPLWEPALVQTIYLVVWSSSEAESVGRCEQRSPLGCCSVLFSMPGVPLGCVLLQYLT